MRFEKKTIGILERALSRLEMGFEDLPDVAQDLDLEEIEGIMLEVADRMCDNYPYFHPLYAGQMLKPPHPIARLAYMLSLWINPNNHALDGGRASSRMEKEVVSDLAGIFNWDTHLGHLTGGGTMANMEALWVAGRINPGKKVVASEHAHYTHRRLSGVLGLGFESIPADRHGRMDIAALEEVLRGGDVGTVVATIGTTGTGSVDPLSEILELREEYGFRLHADAAYGGYFTLVDNLSPQTRQAFDRMPYVDSIVIDPHKHGLQPYGCGCIIYRDPEVGRFYKHDSPYTYFTSSELHLGEISLECSRPGASAVALWATHKLLPPIQGGQFAKGLARSREAALDLYDRVESEGRLLNMLHPELDIVVWAPRAKSISDISSLSERLFQACERNSLYLAKLRYPTRYLDGIWRDVEMDLDTVTCLRSCLMKPEHMEWMDRIWAILEQSIDELE